MDKTKEQAAVGQTEGKKPWYIVRGDRSGVYFGHIERRDGREVTMSHARNIWYWDGAASVMQLSTDGVSEPKKCKFSVYVDELTLTDVIQVIPCTDVAAKCLSEVPTWKQ